MWYTCKKKKFKSDLYPILSPNLIANIIEGNYIALLPEYEELQYKIPNIPQRDHFISTASKWDLVKYYPLEIRTFILDRMDQGIEYLEEYVKKKIY